MSGMFAVTAAVVEAKAEGSGRKGKASCECVMRWRSLFIFAFLLVSMMFLNLKIFL